MLIQKIIAVVAVLSVMASINGYGNLLQNKKTTPPDNSINNGNMQDYPRQDTSRHPVKKRKPVPDSGKSRQYQGNKMHPNGGTMPKRDVDSV